MKKQRTELGIFQTKKHKEYDSVYSKYFLINESKELSS